MCRTWITNRAGNSSELCAAAGIGGPSMHSWDWSIQQTQINAELAAVMNPMAKKLRQENVGSWHGNHRPSTRTIVSM